MWLRQGTNFPPMKFSRTRYEPEVFDMAVNRCNQTNAKDWENDSRLQQAMSQSTWIQLQGEVNFALNDPPTSQRAPPSHFTIKHTQRCVELIILPDSTGTGTITCFDGREPQNVKINRNKVSFRTHFEPISSFAFSVLIPCSENTLQVKVLHWINLNTHISMTSRQTSSADEDCVIWSKAPVQLLNGPWKRKRRAAGLQDHYSMMSGSPLLFPIHMLQLKSFAGACTPSQGELAGIVFNFWVCVCASSWQNVVLDTPNVAGITTEAVFSTLPAVYMLICQQIQLPNLTGV